jgi:hypothetical protein
MELASTQPLIEMSTRNLSVGKERPERKTDNPTTICDVIIYKMWDPRRLVILQASMAYYGEYVQYVVVDLLKARTVKSSKTLCYATISKHVMT